MPTEVTLPENCEKCGSSPLRLEHVVERSTETRIDDEGVGGTVEGMFGMPWGICLACGHRNRLMDRPDAGEKARYLQIDVGAFYASVAGTRWSLRTGRTMDDWNALDNVTRLRYVVAEVEELEPLLEPLLLHTFYWMRSALVANPAYQIHPVQVTLIDHFMIADLDMITNTVAQTSVLLRDALAEAEEAARS